MTSEKTFQFTKSFFRIIFSSMKKFLNWIEDQGGVERVAYRLKVSRMCVAGWQKRIATPNTANMMRLVKMGRGAFDHNDIIKDTHPLLKSRR